MNGLTVISIKKSRDFWSKLWHKQTCFASSHNPNKTPTKIQNNHCSQWTEIKFNGSLTTIKLKKPSRLVGEAKTQNGLVPHPHVVDKHLGGISQE